MNALIPYTIASVVALGIFFSGYALFLRKEPLFRFNRVYLLTSLFLSFLIPLLIFVPAAFPKAMMSLPANGILQSITLSPVEISAASGNNISLTALLGYIYLIGMVFFTARLLIRILGIYNLRQKGSLSDDDISIRWIRSDIPPFSFFNTMYLPAKLKDTHQLHEVIRHEQIHINGFHSFDILCTQIFQIVCWFNPFIPLTENALRENHEFEADKAVLSAGIDPVIYTRILFGQDKTALAVVLGNNFNYSLIKRRLTMFNKTSTRYARLKAIAVLPVAACIVMMFSISCQQSADEFPAAVKSTEAIPAPPPPPPPPPPPSTTNAGEEPVFTVVENMPQYPGGEEARMNYMIKNVKYPKEATEKGIQGTVYVSFIVEKDGSISNTTILKAVGGGLDQEAMRVVSEMPNWKPGTQNGKQVRTKFTMPIYFKLN